MLTNYFLLLTASLGFLSTLYIFRNSTKNNNSLINNHLIFIIVIVSIRFLLNALANKNSTLAFEWLRKISDISILALIPFYFLYFRNLVRVTKFRKIDLVHFVTPFLLTILFFLKDTGTEEQDLFWGKCFVIFRTAAYLTYLFIIYKILRKHIFYRTSDVKIVQKQNKLIRNWSLFLFGSLLMIVITRVIGFILFKFTGSENDLFLWLLALLWANVFIQIIINPEILYGYNFLNESIDKFVEKIAVKEIWKVDGPIQPILIEKDVKLLDKIQPMIVPYIQKIEELSFHTHTFRNPDLSVEDIATSLNIPTSHINFIFKYHCGESFTDYKKIVRINDATNLMKNDFLSNNTIESLSSTVGFSSYNTFNIAFKSITGMTTMDYMKRF
jgi:AraC-like DNA-binding protein